MLQWRRNVVGMLTTLLLGAVAAAGGRFELFRSYLDW